ncbi:MAG TPA: TetR/AcrR family transcriptional regulator [Acidimicrobiales bacterium]
MSPAKRTAETTEQLRALLLAAAERIVGRDGAAALTMRALAAEAGCSVGLPYKVFSSREELVAELITQEFARLSAEFSQLVAAAGTATVDANLGRFADLLLGSPSIGLAHEISHHQALTEAINAKAQEIGVVAALETTVTDYLAAEKRLGRIDADVDVRAFGFFVAGAVHNLLASGEGYPRLSRRQLKRMLAALANRLTSSPGQEKSDADKD